MLKSATFLCLALGKASSFSQSKLTMSAAASSKTMTVPSWSDLQSKTKDNVVGKALENETALRKKGLGSAQVSNTLRQFDLEEGAPQITLYRDHAGWCPYCEKMMLLVEEKRIPTKISLVPMRSYGDKPREFLAKVPNGLLPAMELNGKVITESQVIMEILDQLHPPEGGYLQMLPSEKDVPGQKKYYELSRLERELFSYWCNLIFRPEGPRLGGGGGGGPFGFLKGAGGGGGDDTAISGSMQGFLDCIGKVDQELLSTKGPWFFGDFDHPTMIDFIFVSHVERMLASCAFWKGLDLRDPKWKFQGLNNWLEAFEKREAYLAFKSDYYTHVKDIPPQYGPGCDGGFADDRQQFSRALLGRDDSWKLPLTHDDPIQPLYKGLPLPTCVLESVGITPDASGSYEKCDQEEMVKACRLMAAWKLAGNGEKVAKFAARGGPKGGNNIRKTFGAELADPYANSDEKIIPNVDAALRIVCTALMTLDEGMPSDDLKNQLLASVPANQAKAVGSSLAYLRDRVGVPRDLPLASARYFRAYLNWGIDALYE